MGLALAAAGLQLIEPLFMRYIIDRVLLNAGLDTAGRVSRLQVAGAAFLAAILLSNLIGALKDYRQRLLNLRVMLSLRRALFDRLLHLPLPRLWEMKTGGILSRLMGDIDTPPPWQGPPDPHIAPPKPASGPFRSPIRPGAPRSHPFDPTHPRPQTLE